MMGGALGLAVLASLASSRTAALHAAAQSPLASLLGGYHLAFVVGALFALAGATLGWTLLRVDGRMPAVHSDAPDDAEVEVAA